LGAHHFVAGTAEEIQVSTTDNDASATWLSQEAHDRLQAELDEHIANRPVIAAEINARREEGDLRENGGYHAAREEQGKMEARIRYLQELLRTAKVGEAPNADTVGPGNVVTIYFDDDADDTETFLLGSREISATTELTVYSPESALGKAILGTRSGQTVTYTAPSGADIKVTVVSFEAFAG
jgi:transcription elongation factor GreA